MSQGTRSSSDVRLDGQTVLITGSNTGIGKEIAREVYSRGARVLMAVRDPKKGEAARKELTSDGAPQSGSITVLTLDLESLASVRACAADVISATDKLHLLFLNAGKMACARVETEDGFESQLAANHLGHFLLTQLLLGRLLAAAPSRVVVLSSAAHVSGRIHFDDLQLQRCYSGWRAYCQSKLANLLFAAELGRRLSGCGVTCYAVHPGLVKTQLYRQAGWLLRAAQAPVMTLFRTPAQGALTPLYCALAPELACHTGRYYTDCREATPSARAQSVEDARRLWQLSEQLVGTAR